MSKLDSLLRKVAAEQDALRTGSALPERLASRFRHFTPRARRRAPVWMAVAAALTLLAAFLGISALRSRSALTVAVGNSGSTPLLGAWLGAPDSSSLPLEFSDGSRFELSAKSRARLVELGGSSARVELSSGSLRVHVVPGRTAAWRIDAGPFGVRITGTRFVVSYVPEDDVFELSMDEGEVELSGCVFGTGRKLAAGQRVRASCRTPRLDVSFYDSYATGSGLAAAPASSGPEPASAPPAAAADSPASPKREAATSASAAPASTWFSLAKAGKYQEAYAVAERAGFEAECLRAAPEPLTLLADVARHARAPRKAEHALRSLRRRFPGSPDAAFAAFALGRLEFDEFRVYSAAADWFRTYLKERPSGAMAREALGRLIEASQRAGDMASAEASARRYLRDYPSGPHAELAARLVPAP